MESGQILIDEGSGVVGFVKKGTYKLKKDDKELNLVSMVFVKLPGKYLIEHTLIDPQKKRPQCI